ncbi:glycogenin 1, isoform CRA_c, partial [Absidia repens]
MTEYAYVTLVATDIYAAGALVLGHRLRDFGSTQDLLCLVTGDISPTALEHLSQLYKVVHVDTLKSIDEENLALLGRPELDVTFTKLHLWSLTGYKKLVFLDADTLPLRNIDELFDRPNFSAAPDAGWPDCFNSGVFVTEPSETEYLGLKKMATERGSFDGGDQGLLNSYFSNWSLSSSAHRLPFTYNTTPTSQY